MHQQLLQNIATKYKLSNLDIELCKKYFEPILYPKNKIIEKAGQVPQYLYYIVSGFMRLFHYDDNGDEVTLHINCPHGFFTSFSNFSDQTKSEDNIECITDCELLRINKPNFEALMQQSLTWKNYSVFVLGTSMTYNENRAKDLATLTAEQRYLKLMESYPEIIRNVPLQYIASFLGMKAESLSRIRRKIVT